ncbi:MAG: DUF4190 domain-containing protein [Chloroflexota bacterium]|nr:DUF4190 domain-containing protein [Dehalococcoidia bacterium]MDW8253621.1 DUF4190 domain-containing protein [Chloroflexota bacterium]
MIEYPPPARTNLFALISLLTGAGGVFSCFISPLCSFPFGIVAMVVGLLGLRSLRADPSQTGRELAIAGIALGAAQLVIASLFALAVILVIGALAFIGSR